MATTPHRLDPSNSLANNYALANDNFAKAVQDISDLGAKFSTVGSVSATVTAGSLYTIVANVNDTTNLFVAGRLQIVPRVETFVDNNNNDNYILGLGGSLSAGQANAQVSVWIARRPTSAAVATFVYQIRNSDAISHTYYISVDESYISSPTTGQFR